MDSGLYYRTMGMFPIEQAHILGLTLHTAIELYFDSRACP